MREGAAGVRPSCHVALAFRLLRTQLQDLQPMLMPRLSRCPAPWMQINYTGDAELYAHVPPAGWFTVDTFESHPWCAPARPRSLRYMKMLHNGPWRLISPPRHHIVPHSILSANVQLRAPARTPWVA